MKLTINQILWRECKAMLVMLLMRQNGMTEDMINERWDTYRKDLIDESRGIKKKVEWKG